MPELDSNNQEDLFIWAYDIIDATVVDGTRSERAVAVMPLPDGIILPPDTVVFPPAISWSPPMSACGPNQPCSPNPSPSGNTTMGLFWPL